MTDPPAPAATPRPAPSWFTKKSHLYAYVGAFLGLGSPLGLLFARYYYLHQQTIHPWLSTELRQYGWEYIYTSVATVGAMSLWGLWLGRRVDVEHAQATALKRESGEYHQMAVTDGLTGVYVRRHLLDRLSEELHRSQRYQSSIAALFVDIDNFKSLNDTLGHPFGDIVLRQVAQAIQKCVRETDVVGRYGGDEFLVLLPLAHAREAMLAAERVRKSVEKLSVNDGTKNAAVTVSVGVIAEVPHQANLQRFLSIADQALRRSKGLGKNCTILCDAPVDEMPEKPNA